MLAQIHKIPLAFFHARTLPLSFYIDTLERKRPFFPPTPSSLAHGHAHG